MLNSIFILMVAMISLQSGSSVAKGLFPLVGPMGAAALRTSLASGILMFIWKPWKYSIGNRGKCILLGYGLSLGFMNLSFYHSIQRIPLGIAVALEFLGPLGLALVFSRKYRDFLWVILASLGVFLLLGFSSDSSLSLHSMGHERLDFWGVIFALLAGVCWALYIVFGKKVGSVLQEGVAVALGLAIAAITCLPFAFVQSGVHLFRPEVLPLALSVAVLSSALPYTLEMYVMKKIPTKTFGILMSTEPAGAAISGWILLGESLSTVQWCAIGCIMLASAGSSYFGKVTDIEEGLA